MAKKYYGNSKGGMLQEDKSKPYNCPTEVKMADYPKVDYLSSDIDDTMYGMDEQMNNAVRSARKFAAKKKY